MTAPAKRLDTAGSAKSSGEHIHRREVEMGYGRKTPDTIQSLTKALIGDSLERKRQVKKLIALVRAEEQARVEQIAKMKGA